MHTLILWKVKVQGLFEEKKSPSKQQSVAHYNLKIKTQF